MAIRTLPTGCHKQRDLLIRRQIFSAFTLIELLVVIAIIAILAAILFPVFAQAKRAAKASASLSNAKQHGISLLMYSGDFDDQFVIGGQWHSSDPDACAGYPSSPYMPWTGLVENYLKNRDILTSPFSRKTSPFSVTQYNYCNNARQCALFYPNYGYNISYLSPSQTLDPQPRQMSSISTSSVAKPSEQVMLTEIWSRSAVDWFAFTFVADDGYISFGSAEAPDAATNYGAVRTMPLGYFSWGRANLSMNKALSDEEGKFTAGVAFRCTGLKTPVLFADGHVKVLGQQDLARGTDWIRGTTTRAKNLMNETYMWDPRGD